MGNFWEFSVWGTFNMVAVLLIGLLIANVLKKTVKFLEKSLIPTSVLGGAVVLLVAIVYETITGTPMFDTEFFGGGGTDVLEIITYHSLALGFIATTLQSKKSSFTKKRNGEIFNTGLTTVASYVLQGIFGLGITMIVALIIPNFFSASGVLLLFGYGQGTGQALNYGTIYENEFGFVSGRTFGLAIAALGFISASIGGVIHMNIMRKRGVYKNTLIKNSLTLNEIQDENEIPVEESIDKLSLQIALVVGSYFIAYLVIFGLGYLVPSLKSVLYGFNFLFGILVATLVKFVLNKFNEKSIVKRVYVNSFLMKRISGFFFDLMIVAGVAAIRIWDLKDYWAILLILGLVGALITYFYNLFIAKKLFGEYENEQFLVMYGMLTGTASTGMMLLREVDANLETPASENLIYQNFPAIVFGFPLMLMATVAPTKPFIVWLILLGAFVLLNVILFRSKIFKKKDK